MKLLSAAVLAGVATAAITPLQQPLQIPQSFPSKLKSAAHEELSKLKGLYNDLTPQAVEAWNRVATLYPEQLHAAFAPPPQRKFRRRPNSEWDYIMHGSDVQKIWVENEHGEQEREVGGRLEDYDLRVKKVDPSILGVDPDVKQFSGYLDDKKNGKHLFYWFFESRNDPENDPVILWLNGGPGCSSLVGLFMELGPGRITKNLKVEYNPYSWNANASVIFLDQPVGAGFSYSDSDSVSDSVTAGKDVYALLTLFFKQFPEYAHQDFHIAGESYAGHYIPVFTSEILSHKKTNINLKSVLIGNGLTDGYTQYPGYRPMACGEGGWPSVLDKSTCQSMDNALGTCQSMIKLCYDTESSWLCVPAAIYCNNNILGPYQQAGMNPYDVREKCKDEENLCYTETAWIAQWLNQADVQKALGVEPVDYESCNTQINQAFLFTGDWMMPYHRVVPGILEKIPVLIYAGDADFICNWVGNKLWTEALEWPGQKDFVATKLGPLYLSSDSDDTQIGQVRSSGNFTFMAIHAAGHMVPFNQPEAALAMVNRWVGGEWMN